MGLRSAGAWREFDAPRERVWNTLMDTLREQGMSMENVDPLGGTVEARLSHDRVDLRPGPGETTPTNPVLEGLRNGAPRAFAGTSKNSA